MISTTRSKPNARGGFTLLELLVAMGLLSVISVLSIRLLETSLDLWRTGEEQRDIQEQRTAVRSVVVSDLEAVHAGMGVGTPFVTRTTQGARSLHFARALDPGEEQRLLDDLRYRGGLPERYQGVIASVERTYQEKRQQFEEGKGEGAPPEPPRWYDLVPHRGIAEVAYHVVPDPLAEDPNVLALYRGMTPMGLGSDLSSKELLNQIKQSPYETARFRKVAGSLLYCSWRFRTAWTRSWDLEPLSFAVWATSLGEYLAQPRRGRPPEDLRTPIADWDSTRGTDDVLDDVFPEAVRFTVTVLSEEERERPWRLAQALEVPTTDSRGRSLEKDRVVHLAGPTRRLPRNTDFIKVGAEWMRIDTIDGQDVTIVGRGERGTTPTDHPADTLVYFGSTMELYGAIQVAGGGLGR